MNDNDSSTWQNRWTLANESPELSGHVGLRPEPTVDDQVLMQQLDVYFSCPTHAARVQAVLQSARGALRCFDPFAPADRTHHQRVFHAYQSAMTPIIQDFISRATVVVETLLASCRRFSDTPGRDACPAVAYVLGCEYFEIFMWLMRRENSPWSPSASSDHSNQGRDAASVVRQGGRSLGLVLDEDAPCASLPAMVEEDNTMDMGDTMDTDMAVASPTGLHGQFDDDFTRFLDPGEDFYPDLFSAALGLAREAQEGSPLAAQLFQGQGSYFPRFSGSNEDSRCGGGYCGGGGGGSAASRDIDIDHDDDGCDDDDDDDIDDDNAESSSSGSEEEFYEPDPSDPADGGLPCLALRPWDDWGTMSQEA